MNSKDYWALFLETGLPEYYLMFNNARRMEDIHVSENQGIGASCVGLQ